MKRDITPQYIRGWADRSSNVNVETRSITIRAKNEYPLRSIAVTITHMGIECTFGSFTMSSASGETSMGWELRVGRRKALELWRDLVGFLNKGKAEKLDQILDSYAE